MKLVKTVLRENAAQQSHFYGHGKAPFLRRRHTEGGTRRGKVNLAVPRVVDDIGAVVVVTGGANHSLVTTAEGRVLVFGYQGGGGG